MSKESYAIEKFKYFHFDDWLKGDIDKYKTWCQDNGCYCDKKEFHDSLKKYKDKLYNLYLKKFEQINIDNKGILELKKIIDENFNYSRIKRSELGKYLKQKNPEIFKHYGLFKIYKIIIEELHYTHIKSNGIDYLVRPDNNELLLSTDDFEVEL